METENMLKVVDKFENFKPVKVSQELYQLQKCRWKLSVPAYRFLFALSQSLDYCSQDIFPEIGFDKLTLFKYLGLENSNDRHLRLAETIQEIRKSGIDLVSVDKNGKRRWVGYSWITSYKLSENENEPDVLVRINDDVKPFLLGLKRYAQILPKYYLQLSTEYQNWFYPYLKNVSKLGKWKVSIEDLKGALYLENLDSYNPKTNKNATENFLRYVIGITISEKAKKENQLAKAQKRPAKLIEWDYNKDKQGNYTGTLAGISTHTDLNVTASVEKTGRSYTHIVFFISEKTKSMSKKAQETQHKIAQGMAEEDMTGTKMKGSRKKKTAHIGEIFNEYTSANIHTNPAMEEGIKPRIQYYTEETLRSQMRQFGFTTPEQLANHMRLKKSGDGRYYKEY